MRIPNPPRPGDTITAAVIEQIIRCLHALRIQSVVGGRVSHGPGGTTLVVHAGDGGAGSAALHPFKLIDVSTETPKVRVVYGTVQGNTPSEMNAGDDPQYIFDATGVGYVWAQVTVDIEADTPPITACNIGHGASIPTDSDTVFRFQLGSWNVDAETGKITLGQSVPNSLLFIYCDGSPVWGW